MLHDGTFHVEVLQRQLFLPHIVPLFLLENRTYWHLDANVHGTIHGPY